MAMLLMMIMTLTRSSFPTAHRRRYVPEHTSFRNNEEASAVQEVHKAISHSLKSGALQEPLGSSPGGGGIAVLTSHISQKLRLRTLICGMSDVDAEERETGVSTTTSSRPSSSAMSGPDKDEQERLIETINTVDAFQASNRDGSGPFITLPAGLKGRAKGTSASKLCLVLALTQILIFLRSNKNTVIVQLAMRSGRIRMNYHILAVIIPVV